MIASVFSDSDLDDTLVGLELMAEMVVWVLVEQRASFIAFLTLPEGGV